MSKIAVVGPRDSVLGFKALGLEAVYAQDAAEGEKSVNKLAREGCAIIFVTERLIQDMPAVVERYQNELTPAIIPIPDNNGSIGYGMQVLRANVEKAVGSNILLDQPQEEEQI
ncbi:MAG: V-type ATP synthase subunit F [Eubacteriales bacterium]|nr:V-type ATP synthase subunit F [Eubacteriales bacterium]